MRHIILTYILLSIFIGCNNKTEKSYELPEKMINGRNAKIIMPYTLDLKYKKQEDGYLLTPIVTILSGKPYKSEISEPSILISYNGENISKINDLVLRSVFLNNKNGSNIHRLKPQLIKDIPSGSLVFYEIHLFDPYYPSIVLCSPITELK